MSDPDQMPDEWNEMFAQMNEAFTDSLEQNTEAQAAFMEAFTGAADDSMPEGDVLAEGFEGYNSAYEVWMDAAEDMFEMTTDVAEGEDIDASEFRDRWLKSANEAFKEVMGTEAFASANAQFIEAMMEYQQEVDDMSQDVLSQMGFPTRDDISEVGKRLLEVERRQHALEQKVDQILAELDD
ncbi:MAG: hypothetical protein ACI8XM_002586 [Haloarculaceae archaeon]|jgi:hypothetical protein